MDTNIIYVALAAIVAFLLFQRFFGMRKAPSSEVLEKIRAGARIIDVRTPGEFSGGAYQKAKNIPLDSLPGRLGELGPKDGAIVLYCASGMRSAQAAGILKKAGFTDVLNAGGISAMPTA